MQAYDCMSRASIVVAGYKALKYHQRAAGEIADDIFKRPGVDAGTAGQLADALKSGKVTCGGCFDANAACTLVQKIAHIAVTYAHRALRLRSIKALLSATNSADGLTFDI